VRKEGFSGRLMLGKFGCWGMSLKVCMYSSSSRCSEVDKAWRY
jgi:hypothetical protein